MNTTVRTNQGGSVAVFLIVSVVLAAAVIGGSYALQQRGEYARTNEPVPVQKNETSETDKNKQDARAEVEKQKEAQEKTERETAQKQADEKKRVEEQRKLDAQKKEDAQKRTAAEEAKKNQEQQAATAQTIPQTSTAPSAKSLPQTGPEDTLPQFVGVAILLAVLIAYLKSYRHRFGSLLR